MHDNESNQKQVARMRRRSNRFAWTLIAEIGFCAALYSCYMVLLAPAYLPGFYIVLFSAPLAYNGYRYLSARKAGDQMGLHYAIIAEILVLVFSFNCIL